MSDQLVREPSDTPMSPGLTTTPSAERKHRKRRKKRGGSSGRRGSVEKLDIRLLELADRAILRILEFIPHSVVLRVSCTCTRLHTLIRETCDYIGQTMIITDDFSLFRGYTVRLECSKRAAIVKSSKGGGLVRTSHLLSKTSFTLDDTRSSVRSEPPALRPTASDPDGSKSSSSSRKSRVKKKPRGLPAKGASISGGSTMASLVSATTGGSQSPSTSEVEIDDYDRCITIRGSQKPLKSLRIREAVRALSKTAFTHLHFVKFALENPEGLPEEPISPDEDWLSNGSAPSSTRSTKSGPLTADSFAFSKLDVGLGIVDEGKNVKASPFTSTSIMESSPRMKGMRLGLPTLSEIDSFKDESHLTDDEKSAIEQTDSDFIELLQFFGQVKVRKVTIGEECRRWTWSVLIYIMKAMQSMRQLCVNVGGFEETLPAIASKDDWTSFITNTADILPPLEAIWVHDDALLRALLTVSVNRKPILPIKKPIVRRKIQQKRRRSRSQRDSRSKLDPFDAIVSRVDHGRISGIAAPSPVESLDDLEPRPTTVTFIEHEASSSSDEDDDAEHDIFDQLMERSNGSTEELDSGDSFSLSESRSLPRDVVSEGSSPTPSTSLKRKSSKSSGSHRKSNKRRRHSRRRKSFQSDTLLSRSDRKVRSLLATPKTASPSTQPMDDFPSIKPTQHQSSGSGTMTSGVGGGSSSLSSSKSGAGRTGGSTSTAMISSTVVPSSVSSAVQQESEEERFAFKFVKFACQFSPSIALTGPELNGVRILEITPWDDMLLNIPPSVESLRICHIGKFSMVDNWTCLIHEKNLIYEICVHKCRNLSKVRGLSKLKLLRYLTIRSRPDSFEILIKTISILCQRSPLRKVCCLFDLEKLSDRKGLLSKSFIHEIKTKGIEIDLSDGSISSTLTGSSAHSTSTRRSRFGSDTTSSKMEMMKTREDGKNRRHKGSDPRYHSSRHDHHKDEDDDQQHNDEDRDRSKHESESGKRRKRRKRRGKKRYRDEDGDSSKDRHHRGGDKEKSVIPTMIKTASVIASRKVIVQIFSHYQKPKRIAKRILDFSEFH